MAFGFRVKNDFNNVLMSDQTYNSVYIGKANAGRRFTNGWPRPYSVIRNYEPFLQIQVFSIDGGGRAVIPFVHVTSGYTGVLWYEISGTVYSFYVAVQVGATATVYCFANSTNLGKTGWGITLYDANGKVTFNPQDKILIPKLVYNALTPNSSVFYDDRYQDSVYQSYSLAGVTTNTPLNPLVGTITKPAIMYFTTGTAECYNRAVVTGVYWESCATYSQGNLLTRWGYVTRGANTTTQTPAQTSTAMVIEGADYD